MKPIYALLLSVLLVWSCKDKEPDPEPPLRPVKYEVVGSAGSSMVRTFSAIALAGDEIELSFRSSGIITELNIDVGNVVKKGDLLAELDNIQANLSLQQSISDVNSAQSTLNTSRTNLDRIKVLFEKGSKSLREYESAKNTYDNAKAQYESAIKNRDIQATKVSYGFIYAAADGTIVRKDSELNENVQAGQVIGVLNAGDDINIRVGMPESVINRIELGMQAQVTFSAITDTVMAEVFEISPVLESNSATYPVKFSFNNESNNVRPGMAARAEIRFKNEENARDLPIIPVKAVGEDGTGNFVFVVEENEEHAIVKKTYIQLGELTPDGFEVEEGLVNGQKIATAGLQTLLDNQKVKVTDQ